MEVICTDGVYPMNQLPIQWINSLLSKLDTVGMNNFSSKYKLKYYYAISIIPPQNNLKFNLY